MKNLFILLLCSLAFSVTAQENGAITGIVVDQSNGEPLIAANVRIEGTQLVAFADINGSFTFRNVPKGTYTVVASFAGFSSMTIEEVIVNGGEVTELSFELGAEGIQEDIRVTAELNDDSEIGLLQFRQKSEAISDAISVEEIKRSGGSSAADAVTKITGASVVGGKYVFIRGLGDRYTSTHLNGVEMPTSDPDVKSFQADLFPADILDNIVTVKSFTPDKPGNFSGGIIDIGTRNYPTEFTLGFSLGASYNTQTTGDDDFILYPGSGSDWRGMDDGLRDLPGIVAAAEDIPTISRARRDAELAAVLDEVSKSFEPVMSPTNESAPLNGSFGLSIGDQTEVFGRKLGYLASVTYSRKYSFESDRESLRWKLPDVGSETLVNQTDFDGQVGQETVNWGVLSTLSYTVHPNHELSLNLIRTQGGDSSAQQYVGRWPEQLTGDNEFLESRVLKYVERELTSYQIRGNHFFPNIGDLSFDWTAALSNSNQYEPDTRIFTDNFSVRETGTFYSISRSLYNEPARYFRETDEDSESFQANFSLPFTVKNGLKAEVKFGTSYTKKEREFFEDRYEYVRSSTFRYEGDAEDFFSRENVGVIGFDEERDRFIFGNVIQRAPDSRGGSYSGDFEVSAFYAMLELPITADLRAIFGARNEQAEMSVFNTRDQRGELDDDDILPSVNFIWEQRQNMNWRVSYGRTLARPNFREKAPYTSFDFIADGLYAGNPDLQRTLIDNFDLRWELFPRGGEILAASVFFKDFENPIERAFNLGFASEFGERTIENVDAAEVYGLELEYRKRFDALVAEGSNHIYSVSANLSLIESEVDIPSDELALLLDRDPNASTTRELQGQSPYIINVGLNYDNIATDTSASIFYNVFGERIDEVGLGGAPNSKEQERHQVDFTLSQSVWRNFNLKFTAKNLLDEPVEITQEFRGQSFRRLYYTTGRDFSLSLSYKPQ